MREWSARWTPRPGVDPLQSSLVIADTLLAALPASTGGGFVLFNPDELLPALGPWALAGISLMVFIESGVLFPFLPGDTLLFTAGVLHEALGLQVLDENGKRVKTLTLSKSGKALYSLKLTKKGLRSVKVVYTGNATVAASTSPTKKIRVR